MHIEYKYYDVEVRFVMQTLYVYMCVCGATVGFCLIITWLKTIFPKKKLAVKRFCACLFCWCILLQSFIDFVYRMLQFNNFQRLIGKKMRIFKWVWSTAHIGNRHSIFTCSLICNVWKSYYFYGLKWWRMGDRKRVAR